MYGSTQTRTRTRLLSIASHQLSYFIPQEALHGWDSSLPRDIHTISPALLNATFQEGIDLILASPPVLATRAYDPNKDHPLPGPDIARHVTSLVLHISKTHTNGVGSILNSFELHPPSALTMSLMGPGILLDATECGSGAYRNTRLWQNLMSQDTLAEFQARTRPPTGSVEKALEGAGLSNRSTYPTYFVRRIPAIF